MPNPLDRAMAQTLAERRRARPVGDFARSLTIPDIEDDYGQPVPYDPESHPWQMHVLRLLDGEYGRFHKVLLVADRQGGGKSWVMQIVTFHETVEVGRSVVYGLPTKELKDFTWEQKLRPAIFGAGLGRFMPTRGPGSREGSAPRSVKFRLIDGAGGGHILFMSANSRRQAGQAAVTVQTLIVDELDDWPEDSAARIEGRVDRFASSGKALVVAGGTIKDDYDSNTLRTYEEGTQHRVHYRCHECGEYGPYTWEGFDPEGETIACARCGCVIDDDTRLAQMADTRFVADNPGAHIASCRATALDCPWKSLPWLAAEFRAAKARAAEGDHSKIRQFARDQMTEQYKGDQAQDNPSRDYLATRSAKGEYQRGMAPDWPCRIVVSYDIQGDRVYWKVLARALHERRYAIIDWGEAYYTTRDKMGTEASDEQREAALNDLYAAAFSEGWANSDGDVTHASAAVVDIGYESKAIGAWVRSKDKVFAVRGTGDFRVKRSKLQGQVVKLLCAGLVKRRRQKHAPNMPRYWYFIETDQGRTLYHNALLLGLDQPGAVLLPKGVAKNSRLCRHLCAWEAREDAETGKVDWVQINSRDDLDDCGIYAFMMHQALEEMRWFGRAGDDPDDEDKPEESAVPPPSPANWALGTKPGGWFGGGGPW